MNAKYTITNRPSMIRYTPNALKSFFLIYPSKNLIAPIDTRNDTTIPTISTINCVDVNARPNFTIFNKLAPNITGIPKKNENSAATVLEHPSKIPPRIVAPDLDVPGISEIHQFQVPFHKIIWKDHSLVFFCFVCCGFQ